MYVVSSLFQWLGRGGWVSAGLSQVFLPASLYSARLDSWRLWKRRARKRTLNVINCWSRSRTRWRLGGSTGTHKTVYDQCYGENRRKRKPSRGPMSDLLLLWIPPPPPRQQEAPDLFEWLCIEELRLCCPPGQFGPECKGKLLTRLRSTSLEQVQLRHTRLMKIGQSCARACARGRLWKP